MFLTVTVSIAIMYSLDSHCTNFTVECQESVHW